MRCAPPHHGTLIRPGTLRCSVVARNNDILKRLVLEAKREYEKDAEHRVHIFMADTYVPLLTNDARRAPTELTFLFPSRFAHIRTHTTLRGAGAERTGAGGGTARARSGP